MGYLQLVQKKKKKIQAFFCLWITHTHTPIEDFILIHLAIDLNFTKTEHRITNIRERNS